MILTGFNIVNLVILLTLVFRQRDKGLRTASRLCFNAGNGRRRIALLIGREFQDWISQRAAPSSAVHRPDFEWRCARFP